ncbi:hypothetical protein ACYFX5_14175 [Bremerella sp. T1]|uniref:hypothetical protein n=1 Tax=Bremerella sp. TYQ1 TaxID=3119568 RepID=UPI001CCA93DC|nr:hypothetical protein [Bremerella volcania]UBM34204.1 hypothetical protein LA756_16115 [Bremerella volcania]
MTRKRNAHRSGKRNSLAAGTHLLRAIVLEGMGILLLAAAIGYPILTQTQWRVSCQDCEPSAIDQGLHVLLAKVGLVNEPD